MILVGQYDSPFVRRVAVSLRVLGVAYEHDTRSVYGDFDAMQTINPLGRIPSLVLDDGEVLIDSGAILDWLDQEVGPAQALVPAGGIERRRALRRLALATGRGGKGRGPPAGRVMGPSAPRWGGWSAVCRTPGAGGLLPLAADPWRAAAPLDQAQITTACAIRYVRLADPELLPAGRHPPLDALSDRCEALPAFRATFPGEWAVPRGS